MQSRYLLPSPELVGQLNEKNTRSCSPRLWFSAPQFPSDQCVQAPPTKCTTCSTKSTQSLDSSCIVISLQDKLDNLNPFSSMCNAVIPPELRRTHRVCHVALRLHDTDSKHPIFTFISNSCWIVVATTFIQATQWDEIISSSVFWRAGWVFFSPHISRQSLQTAKIFWCFWQVLDVALWLHPPLPKAILPPFYLFPLFFYSICWRKDTLSVTGTESDW